MLDTRVYVCLSLILRISFVGLNRGILKILMIEGGHNLSLNWQLFCNVMGMSKINSAVNLATNDE